MISETVFNALNAGNIVYSAVKQSTTVAIPIGGTDLLNNYIPDDVGAVLITVLAKSVPTGNYEQLFLSSINTGRRFMYFGAAERIVLFGSFNDLSDVEINNPLAGLTVVEVCITCF